MSSSITSRIGRLLLGAAVGTSLALAAAAPAHAAFGIAEFSAELSPGTAGASATQAGAHADLTVNTRFASKTVPLVNDLGETFYLNDGHVRKMIVDLPAGMSGDPNGVPRCRTVDFAELASGASCPVGSQVGLLNVLLQSNVTFAPGNPVNVPMVRLPVYLIEPTSDEETARLGAIVANVPVIVSIRPRADDLGLRATIEGIPGGAASPVIANLALWGVPSDPSHDLDRLGGFGFPLSYDEFGNPAPTPSQAPRSPFLTNPTSCGEAQPTVLRAASFEDPGTFVERSAPFPVMTGCEALPFAPSISAAPVDARPDSPSGYEVSVRVPQRNAPEVPAAAHVRTVDLTLPPGVVISPAGASGLAACDDAALGLGSDADATCPAATRLGSASFDVPILPGPINGSVYLRTPQPGHLFRLALVAKGYGVNLKIVGEATPDPATGQLRAVFENAPQQPFSGLTLRFDGGPRAALANPEGCGPATTTGTITGWNGATTAVSDAFTISADGRGAACGPRGFAPSLRAGTSRSQAGAASPLVVEVARRDSEGLLRRLDVQFPSGITAKVTGVPLCPAAAAVAGTCDEGSRVGRADVGAGSGPAPLYLGGRVYFTEGYGGAPYGLSIVVPAKVGPFDLGDVVVRARVFVDRKTAALRVLSEDLPTILQGVPLRIKDIRIAVDRPGFMLNPTGCRAAAIGATVTSLDGAAAQASAPFQPTGCAGLGFKPSIAAESSGRRWKGSGGSLKVTVKVPAGQSNLGRVAVRLPDPISARGTTINKACTSEEWARAACKDETRAGTATAFTPILPQPLTGGVYFVARPTGQRGLPQLRIILRGNGLEIHLVGDVVINADRSISTTFPGIPDVPISTFEMNLPQGPNSLLDVSRSLCGRAAPRMRTDAFGQNGARQRGTTTLKVTGCKVAKKKTKAKAKTRATKGRKATAKGPAKASAKPTAAR